MIAVDEQDLVVARKTQNHRLWQSGAYGCRLRSWSLAEWLRGGRAGRWVLRTLGAGGGSCCYGLYAYEVAAVAGVWVGRGVPSDVITVDEEAPADAAILQGEYYNEVFLDDGGYPTSDYLHYSRERSHMREALRHAPEPAARGLRARLLLREVMTPASLEDWEILVERYPGHVLEISVYDRCLGDLPGRNALVWEVRKY